MTVTNLSQCHKDALLPVGRILKRRCSECGGQVRVEATGAFCVDCGIEVTGPERGR